jgi:uncharacterized membrane protein YcaP (DUF421 family)
MGKKQLSQLTFFDYVVGISIGSIAAAFAVDPSIGYARGITALILYALFPIVLSLIALKSYRARKLLDGKPTILIWNGQIMDANLKKAKLTVNDVLEECRLNSVFDVADVAFAVLETNGRVSVQPKAGKRPLTAGDMNIPAVAQGLCINIVVDGEILDDHLVLAGIDNGRLIEELRRQGVTDCREVLLAYVDPGGQLVVHKRNGIQPPNPLI